jgi:hypothetical protein
VQTLLLHVAEFEEAGQLILRNRTEGNQPARFSLRRLEILRDETLEDPVAQDVESQFAAVQRPPSETSNRQPLPIEAIQPSSAQAIVRLLGDPEREDQAMIILPTDTGAAMNLPAGRGSVSRVIIHLHVIEGEASVALQRRETSNVLVEHRQPPGPPMTRVDLVPDEGDGDLLVIRNTAAAGRATLLVHRIECDWRG